MSDHGTVRHYKSQHCRCEPCKTANADYVRRKREEARARGFANLRHGIQSTYNAGCRCDLCVNSRHRKHRTETGQAPYVVFERRVLGDALQLVGLIREHGPDTIRQLLDQWGPDHIRHVCLVLAGAVDPERTPKELWGWLGPVDRTTSTTVPVGRLFNQSDPHTLTVEEIHDLRPADPRQRIEREYRRRQRGAA
jgi:hypothetical protein